MDFPIDFFRNKRRNLKQSAKSRNKDFNLSSEFIKKLYSDVRCFYSGKELKLDEATIDRLDCNKGYVESNVVIACDKTNNLKGQIEIGKFVPFEKLQQKVGKKAALKIIYYARLLDIKSI